MTQQILTELQSWNQFRRALRVEEREVFDELFRSVRMHVAEVSMAARLLPFEAMLMSMLVSQGMRLRVVEQQVAVLKKLQNRGGQESVVLPQTTLPQVPTALPHSPGQVSQNI